MGWWSYNVMGGDLPLDFMGKIAELCGLYLKSGNPYSFTKEILETNLDRIVLNIQNDEEFTEDNEIAWQVLGHLLLDYGVSIPPNVKEYILAGYEYDKWSEDNDTRRNVLNDYMSRIAELT